MPPSVTIIRLLLGLSLMLASGAAMAQPVLTNMAAIPAGTYLPAFRMEGEAKAYPIKPFLMDLFPVTEGQFLQFVTANPAWRRSQIKRLFADENYLRNWAGDLELGPGAPVAAPVTCVSWFAARAYARWAAKRLPSTAEWEFVARANSQTNDASADPAFQMHLRKLYLTPFSGPPGLVGQQTPNVYGIHDLHGLVWEWVSDFNTAMVTGDARGDTGLDRQLFCGAGGLGARDQGDFAAFMRFAYRSSLRASYTVGNLGFRCVRDL